MIATAAGLQSFLIGGVFFDYRSDQGIVLLHRRLYDRLWRDSGISSLGLYLATDVDPDVIRADAERIASRGRLRLEHSFRR